MENWLTESDLFDYGKLLFNKYERTEQKFDKNNTTMLCENLNNLKFYIPQIFV